MNLAIKAINKPSISKAEIEKLSIGAVHYAAIEEKYSKLRGQMVSFGSLFKTQMDKLKSTGVKF